MPNDQFKGKLVVDTLPETLAWGKPLDFIKKLTKILAVVIPARDNLEFVVVSSQTPTEDDKQRPWYQLGSNGGFLGLGMFQKGSWRRVQLYTQFDVVWKWGDSRNIEDGYKLIDGSAGLPADTQAHIMKFYQKDLTVTDDTVYKYFAVQYVGF